MKEPFYTLNGCIKSWRRVGSLIKNTTATDVKSAEEGSHWQSAIYGTRLPSTKPTGTRFVQGIPALNKFGVFTIDFKKEKGLKSSENIAVYLCEPSS